MMSILSIARSDAARFIRDAQNGGAESFTLTSPLGEVWAGQRGWWQDIAQTVDPKTGEVLTGRLVTVTLATEGLSAIPRAIADSAMKPWLVSFDGVVYKVAESTPDTSLGTVTCVLERYNV